MLYAAILRSPVASGRVVSLDLAQALAIPGVRGAVDHDDMPNTKLDGIRLFDREIHYAGQPLAAVCADSLEIARRAVDAIRARHRRGRARGRHDGGARAERTARPQVR